MGFFHRMGNAIARMMYGRNGPDKLGATLLWTSVIVNLVSAFVLRNHRFLGSILYYAALGLMIYTLFRMFSKNLNKRRAENQRYLNWLWRMKSNRAGAKARHADKDHKYFTCKTCGTICHVPVGKGSVVITCPKCGAQIHGKT